LTIAAAFYGMPRRCPRRAVESKEREARLELVLKVLILLELVASYRPACQRS
jgi:hypothetical protein